MKLDRNRIKKILVIKFGGIGDILLATPVLPNLKDYFPDAEINFLTIRHSRDILIDNPYLSRAFTYDPSEDKSWCLIKNIRKQNYDLIIDLYCNPRTALITFMSGAKYRFGFKFRGRSYAYNITAEGRGGEVHIVEFNLDALRHLGIPVKTKDLYLSTNIVHEEFTNDFFNRNNISSKFLIGISLTGGWEAKRYKVPDYIELIKMINKIYDVNFILFGGNERELNDCKIINEAVPGNTYIAPYSPIKYLASMISRCDMLIGNDSGPLHISAAMKVPTLGIYGPTLSKLASPFGEKNLSVYNDKLDCLGCGLLECNIGNICMTELPKNRIIEKVNELIKINNLQIT
ncbi:MAG TPA: glycosyltransferase family 9 protein [Ignavibacteria bacterium]|nr:glycosyltransferase family 9 protein [Ignavibacteria bacterium]